NGFELLLPVADRDTDVQSPVTDVIERGDVLGRLDGIHDRQEEHRGLEAHPAGLRSHPGQHGKRLWPHGGVRQQVLADRDPRVPHARRSGDDLNRLVDDLRRMAIGRAPERREMKADAEWLGHGGLYYSPSPVAYSPAERGSGNRRDDTLVNRRSRRDT